MAHLKDRIMARFTRRNKPETHETWMNEADRDLTPIEKEMFKVLRMKAEKSWMTYRSPVEYFG